MQLIANKQRYRCVGEQNLDVKLFAKKQRTKQSNLEKSISGWKLNRYRENWLCRLWNGNGLHRRREIHNISVYRSSAEQYCAFLFPDLLKRRLFSEFIKIWQITCFGVLPWSHLPTNWWKTKFYSKTNKWSADISLSLFTFTFLEHSLRVF